jgi:hypothetical protein
MRFFSDVVELLEPSINEAENEHGPANVAAKHGQVLTALKEDFDAHVPKSMRVEVQNAYNVLICAAVEALTQQKKLPAHTPPPA